LCVLVTRFFFFLICSKGFDGLCAYQGNMLGYIKRPKLCCLAMPDKLLNMQGYLTKNKFTFPVLRAFEYGRSNGINAIPDTWLVDTNGNRVYEGVAGSKELVEEFIWRVEELRASNKSTATK
jgi:hypothetical protein